MTRSLPIPVLAALVLAASGCGSDGGGDPIPRPTARALAAQLDDFQNALDAGACEGVDGRIRRLHRAIGTLDEEGVDASVQDALGDGVDHLRSLAVEVCNEAEQEVETTPETTIETTPETTPTTTPTPPPQPEPEPLPEPEPEPLPEEPDEVPPDQGDGSEQFDPEQGDGGVPPGQLKKQEDDG